MQRSKLLLINGYPVIPSTIGSVALVDDDKKYESSITESWIERFPDANISLVLGRSNLYALRFNIIDHALSRRIKTKIINDHPLVAIRAERKPSFSFLLLFRAEKDLSKFISANSKIYNRDKLMTQGVHMIGGGLEAAYGHDADNNKYRWKAHHNCIDIPLKSLSILSLQAVKDIFYFFEQSISDRYSLSEMSKFSKRQTSLAFDETIASGFTEEQIQAILDNIEGNNKGAWIKVGMALYHQFDGKKEGLLKWDNWSSKFEGYKNIDDCRRKWLDFRSNGGEVVTMQNLTSKVVVSSPKNDDDDLQDMINNLVLIIKGKLVADMRKSPAESVMTFNEMVYSTSHQVRKVKVEAALGGNASIKSIPVIRLWQKSDNRIIAIDTAYYPSKQRVLKNQWRDKSGVYYNIYNPPDCNITGNRSLIHYFKDHIKYLFGGENDSEWMICWMAQLIQHPETRYRVAPLSISTFHGTGRGWLGQLLHKLVGRNNMSTIPMITDIIRDGAKTGFMNDSLLCLVSETYSGKKRHSVDSKLRQILGDNYQNVDVKYGEQIDKQIYTRFWFQSNHIEGLAIDELDNRIECFINNQRPKSSGYYDEIYRKLQDDHFINQVYSYLSEYNYQKRMISDNWLRTSRRTKARQLVIQSSKSQTSMGFYQFKVIVCDDFFTDSLLGRFMLAHIVIKTDSTTHSFNQNKVDSLEIMQLKKEQIVTSVRVGELMVHSFTAQDISSEEIIVSYKRCLARLQNFIKEADKDE